MSITETIHFDKEGRVVKSPLFRKLFLAILIILVAALSFGVGRLSVGEGEAVRIEYDPQLTTDGQEQPITNTAAVINSIPSNGSVVASKNGTKYHFLHCSGAKQIKDENKLYFPTPAAAEASGYTLAGNCSPR